MRAWGIHWALVGAWAVTAAETSPQPPAHAVRLDILADDSFKDGLRQGLEIELRKRDGVRLSDSRDADVLTVIATEQRMTDGRFLGYLVYTAGSNPACLDSGLTTDLGPPLLIRWQKLRLAPPGLADLCARIVAEFAAEVWRMPGNDRSPAAPDPRR
jgi:hypothetical protein